MTPKLFEIRDAATFIPVLAVQLNPADEYERYLLARSGYGLSPEAQAEYVQLLRIAGGSDESHYDPHRWSSGTMAVAHAYIIENWSSLRTGDVVDVQFIRGETSAPKVSERLTEPRY